MVFFPSIVARFVFPADCPYSGLVLLVRGANPVVREPRVAPFSADRPRQTAGPLGQQGVRVR